MEPEQEPSSRRRYAVFLSYRHADNKEAGRQWATWLHHLLEGYEIPEDLAGRKNSKGDLMPASLYPVFRDEEELPADADLTGNIRRALENSELLVVLCSPRAVESRFVADEIRYFKELGKANRILALMIDGEPNAADDPGKAKLGIQPETECLPEPLRYGVAGDDGTINWSRRTEPIAADVRPDGKAEQGWTTGAAYREALQKDGKLQEKEIAQKVQEYEQRLELAKLKVVAGALGVPLGELTQRDKAMQLDKARKRARTLKLWLAAVGLLALLAVAGGIYARFQRQEAVAQRKAAEARKEEALQTLSKSDFLQAVRLINEKRSGEAIAFLIRSLSEYPDNQSARARLTTLLEQHNWGLPVLTLNSTNPVWTADFSPDGHRILTTSRDGTAQIWDAGTGRRLFEVKREQAGTRRFAQFSPDGTRIVISSTDGTARVWDVATGAQLFSLQHQGPVNSAQYSPDGLSIVTASEDMSACLWNATNGQMLVKMQDTNAMIYAQTSSDGRRVVTVTSWIDEGQQNPVRSQTLLWDARSGQLISRIYGDAAEFSPDCTKVLQMGYRHPYADVVEVQTGKSMLKSTILPKNDNSTMSAGFSPEAGRLVTFSDDGTAQVWDAQTGQALTEPLKHDGPVNSAEFSRDGKWIVTASKDGTARVWDSETGQPLAEPVKLSDEVDTAQFSPDDSRILALSDGMVSVWSVHNHSMLSGRLQSDAATTSSSLGRFFVSPDAKEIALTSVADKVIYSTNGRSETRFSAAQVWNIETGMPVTGLMIHSNNMNAFLTDVEFSPDGRRLATASMDHTARIWDAQTGKPLTPFLKHDRDVYSAKFSPDGLYLVTASWDGTARIWDAHDGHLIRTLKQPEAYKNNAFENAGFSPDGQNIITGDIGNDIVQVWNAQSGQWLFSFSGGDRSPFLSREYQWLIIRFSNRPWQVWDVEYDKLLASIPPLDYNVEIEQFSSDGKKILAVKNDNNTVLLLDSRTGEKCIEPLRHPAAVRSAQFSRDGRWIVTACADGMARIWDPDNGQLVADPLKHDGEVQFAEFSPDGRFIIVSVGQPGDFADGLPRFWDFAPRQTSVPDWLPTLAEAVGGGVLDGQGIVQPTKLDRLAVIDRIRQKLNQSPDRDDWTIWGRWFMADQATRTISPFSKITVPQYFEDLNKARAAQSQ